VIPNQGYSHPLTVLQDIHGVREESVLVTENASTVFIILLQFLFSFAMDYCACGETNSVDQHNLIYKLSGYASMRHNSLRDSEAQIMREVCRDVQIEPTVLPINENQFERKVNTFDNARLVISTRGWNSCEKTFFALRITRPTLQSYSDKSLLQIHQQHEKEKKGKYNQRVIEIR